MKFNLPKFEVPKVPNMHFGRGSAEPARSSAPSSSSINDAHAVDASGTSHPGPGATSTAQAPGASSTSGFGAKSKEQMSNFLRKTRRTLTPRSRQQQSPSHKTGKQQSEPPVGTELQKSSSDPHVVTNSLKGILKGRGKNKSSNKSSGSTPSSGDADADADVDMDPDVTPDDENRMFASSSELGSYNTTMRGDYGSRHQQGDLKSMESGSRSTMGMAREHSQSSIIEKIKASTDGYDTINRPPRPPPPKRFQRHKPKANKSNARSTSEPPPAVEEEKPDDDHSPPRPSRRKEPVGQRHLRVNRDIPYMEEGVPEVENGHHQPDTYPCPFIFETHDTFGDTEAFVEMLTNNILKDSWEGYKGQVSPGSASAPTTLRKLPKSSNQQTGVGPSLIKALELQVEIEQKLNEDRKNRERRLKDIQQWEEELRTIKLPDVREIKQKLATSRESPPANNKLTSSPYYPSMTHSLDRATTRFRQAVEEFQTPPESPTLAKKGALVTPRTKRRQVSTQPPPVPQKRSATLPRKADLPRPKAPERKKKHQGSRFSLPDYKIGPEIGSASETDTGGRQNRPLPPPPMPPRLRHTGYATLKSAVPHQEKKAIRIEDVPPDVIQAIIEISKSVFLGKSANNKAAAHPEMSKTDTIKELGEGLSVPELKVKKLSIEELSAVRIIVNNLAAKHVVADKANFGKIYSNSFKQDSLDHDASNTNGERKAALASVAHADHVSTEDISKTEDVSLATATFESARCETTTESSITSQTQFDTDLDCDSDLEGSIKSVEIAFDAIEETLQTFKDTIASGPVVPSVSPSREIRSSSPANMSSGDA